MTTRIKPYLPLIAGILLVAGIALSVQYLDRPLLVYNATQSAPIGFYRVLPVADYQRDDLVLFAPPAHVRALVQARRWLPKNGYLMKPIAALSGDFVCTDSARLTINHEDYGAIREQDSEGRPLPHVDYCQATATGSVYLANRGQANSFDSRYFGPIAATAIIGRVEPLWIF